MFPIPSAICQSLSCERPTNGERNHKFCLFPFLLFFLCGRRLYERRGRRQRERGKVKREVLANGSGRVVEIEKELITWREEREKRRKEGRKRRRRRRRARRHGERGDIDMKNGKGRECAFCVAKRENPQKCVMRLKHTLLCR